MKRLLLSVLACALAVLLGSESLSEAQTKKRKPPVGRSDKKSKVVAVNTNELEGFPMDSGELKFIASSEDTNGAFAVVERMQQPCYKTTWHRHDNFEESFYVLEGLWTVKWPTRSMNFQPARTC
jgi:quercetin dioxygenase-like cupin family protein